MIPHSSNMRKKRIGLLMGSFNPAHQGHIHLSNRAQKTLHLQQIWWLVTPHNPLKNKDDLQPLADRINMAKNITQHIQMPNIKVTAPEQIFTKNYTAHSLAWLIKALPAYQFILLMGSDNLCQLPRWHRADKIIKQLPIAIIRRQDYHYPALLRFRGKLQGLKHQRNYSIVGKSCQDATKLIYIDGTTHHASATKIRSHQQHS